MNATTWRRHWKIPAGLLLVVVALVVALGDFRVIAYVGSGGDDTVATGSYDIDFGDETALFDASVVHEVELAFAEADLDSAIANYLATGEKDYFQADITINGTTIEGVGIRMKGNSTLNAALQSGANPDDIPFLVKLNKYNSGVNYQGYTELALRTEGPRGDDVILEEIVTADVLESAGLPFPETSYVGLSINGQPETLRVLVELLDNGYVERLYDDTGVLYKAQSGTSFTYLGHDPTEYVDAFTQETSTNQADLEPLIDFLEFVETATDEEFESELAEWLDVDSFVSYVAVNNLLASVDSMPGNGNNYYLWYDSEDDRFTVLAWDLNESFGGFWMARNTLSTELLPDWSNLSDDSSAGRDQADGAPSGAGQRGRRGAEPGAAETERTETQQDTVRGGQVQVDANLVAFDYNNPLVDRFLANASLRERYLERYADLQEILFTNGTVAVTIEKYAEIVAAANVERSLVTDAELATAVASKLAWVEDRASFLDALGEW